MKTAIVLTTLALSMSSAFAKPKDKCSMYINEPRITHDQMGTNTNQNPVNAGVVKILMNNGFTITRDEAAARYQLHTEVRCGTVWTFFGMQNACQTAIEIYDYKEGKIAYTDGPTPVKPGLNIDFNSINFPKCSDL